MKKKILALVTALGIITAAVSPANAWYGGYYGGWGGYGWGGYGAGLGIMAGSALLGGIIGGAIANQGYGYGGGYGYGYPAYRSCYISRIPVYDGFGNFAGYRNQTVC